MLSYPRVASTTTRTSNAGQCHTTTRLSSIRGTVRCVLNTCNRHLATVGDERGRTEFHQRTVRLKSGHLPRTDKRGIPHDLQFDRPVQRSRNTAA